MDNCGLSLSSTPTRRVEDLDNLRFFFMFCLKSGVTQGCVSAGLGGWGRKMGEERGRKTSLLLSSVGTVFACMGREMVVVSLPLDFLQ